MEQGPRGWNSDHWHWRADHLMNARFIVRHFGFDLDQLHSASMEKNAYELIINCGSHWFKSSLKDCRTKLSVESQKGTRLLCKDVPLRTRRVRLHTTIVPFWFSMEHLWILIAPFWFSMEHLSILIAPFWFSMEYLWIAPFWLSTDKTSMEIKGTTSDLNIGPLGSWKVQLCLIHWTMTVPGVKSRGRLHDVMGYLFWYFGISLGLCLHKTFMKKLAAFKMWIYRRLGRIPWTEKRTNQYVL